MDLQSHRIFESLFYDPKSLNDMYEPCLLDLKGLFPCNNVSIFRLSLFSNRRQVSVVIFFVCVLQKKVSLARFIFLLMARSPNYNFYFNQRRQDCLNKNVIFPGNGLLIFCQSPKAELWWERFSRFVFFENNIEEKALCLLPLSVRFSPPKNICFRFLLMYCSQGVFNVS